MLQQTRKITLYRFSSPFTQLSPVENRKFKKGTKQSCFPAILNADFFSDFLRKHPILKYFSKLCAKPEILNEILTDTGLL